MPSPLVLRVLGPVQLTGIGRPLTSQQLALLTFVACVGPARRETLVEALWGGRPISERRFANLISEIRAAIGRRHLPSDADNRYRVVDLPTDLELLQAVTGRTARVGGAAGRQGGLGDRTGQIDRADSHLGDRAGQADEAEIVALESAIGLIRGPVFIAPPGRAWWWLDAHPEVVANADAAVGQAAHRLVSLLRHQGELDRAREVCRLALSWCPLDRDLLFALEGLHRAQGRPAAAHRLVTSWRLQVQRMTGEDPLELSGA